MVLSTFWLAIGDSSKITSNVLVANSMSVLSTIAVNIDPSRGQTSRVTCGLLLIGRFHVGVLCHHLVPIYGPVSLRACVCHRVVCPVGLWLVLAFHSGLGALVGSCIPFRTGGSGWSFAHHSGLVALVDPCTPFRTGGFGWSFAHHSEQGALVSLHTIQDWWLCLVLAHHSGLVALVGPCTPFRTGGSGWSLHTIQDWWLWLILAHHSGLVALFGPCTPFRTGGSG